MEKEAGCPEPQEALADRSPSAVRPGRLSQAEGAQLHISSSAAAYFLKDTLPARPPERRNGIVRFASSQMLNL